LVGIAADPIQSREHVLLSSILETAWRGGQDLDLPSLIGAVQSPPLTKIGVLDVDAFFLQKDRFALAMALNNLVAAPGFAAWTEGEPINVRRCCARRPANRGSPSSRSPTSTTRSGCSS